MSPIVYPKAVQRVGDAIRLIDQTRLPSELAYIDIDDYRELILAIKRLVVRGAPAIGIAAGYGLALAVSRSNQYELADIERLGKELKASRPTAVNLFWAIDRLIDRVRSENPSDHRATVELLWQEAEAIHLEDEQMCRRIGEYGAELIGPDHGILTHCNAGALATGGIGTALGVVYVCQEQGKNPRVFADETRPLLQGSRLTAWELMQVGVDVTLLTDSMAAIAMQKGMIDTVIVGADRIAANGDTANKIGTYGVALLAHAHNIPFYVAAPTSTFDSATPDGNSIPIEQRDPLEITCGFGHKTAPDGVKVFSPAFDVTPINLISAYITDQGLKAGGRD